MLARLPSLTSIVVASARGLAEHPDAPGTALDPLAAEVLPRPLGAVVDGLRPLVARGPARRATQWAMVGLWDHLVLRTLAIDAALDRARAEGCDQVVLVGAGLDTRARRLPSLAGATVWEVDHPSTQALVAHLPSPAIRVPADLARQDLGVVLHAAGHDPTRPTAWLWEGVTMYLTADAIDATLGTIAERSPTGSHLLVTYAEPELSGGPRWIRPITRTLFGGIGEPLVSTFVPEAFAAHLDDAGFDVLADEGDGEWAAARDWPVVLPIRERLAVARRR